MMPGVDGPSTLKHLRDGLNNDYPATRRSLDTDRVKSYAWEVSTPRTLR